MVQLSTTVDSPSATLNPVTSTNPSSGNAADLIGAIMSNPNIITQMLTSANQSQNPTGVYGGGGVDDSGGDAALNAFNDLTSTQPSSASLYPTATYNASDFNIPDASTYYQAAFNAVAPYYQKLLDEANGDLQVAMTNLQNDYTQGVRFATQDLAQTTGQTLANMQASLQRLTGVTFPSETQAKVDTLNQRGIATVQPNLGASVQAASAQMTGNQAGYELGQLSEDQQLRKEAVERTAQQTIQSAGLSAQQTQESAQKTLTQGQQTASQNYRTFAEQAKQQMDTDITSREQTAQQNALQQQQLDITKAQLAATPGTNIGNSASGNSGYVDPTVGGFGSASKPDLSNQFKINDYNAWKASQQA